MTLREWCRANWNKLPEMVRKDCLDHLEAWLKEGEDFAGTMAYLKTYDKKIGFHMFGGGMAIRNRLREQYSDMELPIIMTDHKGGHYGPSQNWDDYYTGALDELLERYP